jgi:hypothetical protein
MVGRDVGVVRWGGRVDVVDHVSVGRDEAVFGQPDQVTLPVEPRVRHHVFRCVLPDRGASAEQPEVVEHGLAKRPGEVVVSKRIGTGVGVEGEFLGLVVAHRQAARVGPGDELVHLAVVHLQLVLVEAVKGIARQLGGRDVGVDQEWSIGQVVREALFGLAAPERLRQGLVGIALLVHLLYSGAGLIEAVGAGELAIQVIEGVVFLEEDYEVVDRCLVRLCWSRRRGRTGAQEQ